MLGQKIEILRMYFIEEKGKKQISRELNISRNTVKSYINDFLESKKELLEQGCSSYELIENMIDKPKYKCSGRPAIVMTDEIKEIINKFLESNESKRHTGNMKLLMTAKDMHEELIELGFSLSYPTVAQYVQKYKYNQHSAEAFIKQYYEFGHTCEFDWGDVKLVVDGKTIKFKIAIFTLAKSNYRFAYLYRYENTQCFVDAHIRFFRHINGIPKIMVYDNMKVAVGKFVGRTEKEATIGLKQLSVYYGFGYRFCNIASGNEKGHVENSVEFVRRKAFSCCNVFDDLESANERLRQKLEKYNNIQTQYLDNMSPSQLLNIEQGYLSEHVPDYSNCILISARVDKLSTISYLQNRYSVPDYLVKKMVEVRIYIDTLDVYFNNTLVASHQRLFGNKEWSIDINHFIKTLSRKPGALVGSLAFSQMNDSLKKIYKKYFCEVPRDFIFLLDLIGENGIEPVESVMNKLEEKGINVNIDNIKMILNKKDEIILKNVVHTTSHMQQEIEDFSRMHLKQYDVVIGTGNIMEATMI